jgi:hypothetical protein
MATHTDFKTWLSGIDIDDYNDIYCLYKAVEEQQEWGAFDCSKRVTSKGNMYFVSCCYMEKEILMLASDKAREYFMDHIEKTYADEGMGIEAWYQYKYAMEKND